MRILLIGPPGSGKGTQGNLISKHYGIKTYSMGDMLREIRKKDTPLAESLRSYMDKGALVPDVVVNSVVQDRLGPLVKNEEGFMLDGYPRTVQQADVLDTFCKFDLALQFDAEHELLVKRLSGRFTCADGCGTIYNSADKDFSMTCKNCGNTLTQRKDDTVEAIANRLKIDAKESSAVVNFYKDQNILRTIKNTCSTTPDQIFAEIQQIIGKQKPLKQFVPSLNGLRKQENELPGCDRASQDVI